MVNANLGPGHDLAQRIAKLEGQMRVMATQPVLLNASTGQDGGQGVTVDQNGIHLFDPTGVERVRLDTLTGYLHLIGSVGTLDIGSYSGNTVPIISFLTTDGGGVQSHAGQIYQSYNTLLFVGPQTTTNSNAYTAINLGDTYGQMNSHDSAGAGAAYVQVNNDKSWSLAGSAYVYGYANGTWLFGNGSRYLFDTGSSVQVGGGLTVLGSKNFVMDHPTKPGWLLKHASTESPHNGVEYWGSGTLDASGESVVTLPGYFEALTLPDNRNVQITAIGRATVPISADRISSGAFTVYGAAGQDFDWLVKAVRHSTNPEQPIDFDVEAEGSTAPPPQPPAPPAQTDQPVMTAPDPTPPATTPSGA